MIIESHHERISLVKNYLIEELNAYNTESNINFFLDQLLHGNVDSKRLLICMGIDLKTYRKLFSSSNNFKELKNSLISIISEAAVVENFESKSYSSLPPEIRFGVCLREKWNDNKKNYLPKIYSEDSGEEYTRVVSLSNFVKYIVKARGNALLNRTGEEDMYETIEDDIGFYRNEYENKNKFRKVKITYLGSGTGWVFLADKKQIKETIDKTQKEDLCITIVDRLGFYVSTPLFKEDLLINLDYPKIFEEITYQPNLLTGDWGNVKKEVISKGNEYYLSYHGSDNWGRTFSVSGNTVGFKERLHSEFDYNGSKIYEMESDLVGSFPSITMLATEDQVVEEALNRFENA